MGKYDLAHTFISIYQTMFKQKYKRAVVVNRNTAKWGMVDVIDSIGKENVQPTLEYFFKLSIPGHPLQTYYNNYDKYLEQLELREKDRERRRQLLAETRERVENEHRSSGD